MHSDLNLTKKKIWVKTSVFLKTRSGSYQSAPLWLSALFVQPHAKSTFRKSALNTDLSGNTSKVLPLRGNRFCRLLQWRASCTSTTLTFTNSSTKTDKCIHETFLLLSWLPVISYILWQIINHVCFRKRTEHLPSRFSRRKQKEPRNTNTLFFLSATEKQFHIT